jgi:hypothetical protein
MLLSFPEEEEEENGIVVEIVEAERYCGDFWFFVVKTL